jgi:histidinol-phosphate aminotransferase
MSLTRPDLAALPSYVPGRTVPGTIKLASNEVPYGPLPGVVEAITEAARASHRYPDMAVVVLRTLSKAWGLAGLRIGYAIAPTPVAEAVRKVVTPFSASGVAQAAALAALSAAGEMHRRAGLVVAERERVQAALQKMLPEVPDTQANFVWLPLRERSTQFAGVCERHGVIVRPFPEGVRVTVGTPEENDTFLAAAEAALSSP